MCSTISTHNKIKSDDIIGSYNSLKDPHLKIHFRKPQIRSHLLKANIINKDNKIVEEISRTKHQQNVERKQKRELYQMLNEMVKKQNQTEKNSKDPTDNYQSIVDSKEFLNRALFMFNGEKFKNFSNKSQDNVNTSNHRELLLQKIDRMIKAIKERDEKDLTKPRKKINDIKSNLQTKSKSTYDISTQSLGTANCKSFNHQKSYLSTPQLNNEKLLISKRPKSSYGRSRNKRNIVEDDSVLKTFHDSRQNVNLEKSVSLANVHLVENDENVSDEIKSLDGDSFNDSESSNDNDEQKIQSPMFFYNKNPKKFPLQKMISDANHHCSSSSGSNGGTNAINNKKYYAFDKRFVKTYSSGRQRVKMTLSYNGLNEATNMGGKRNVKVYQQITVGGNSILIYDGFVKPGGAFSFDIRPHINNSFAINILVNGIRDLRLNTCCERKHRPGTKLSHFTIVDIVGGHACFNCQMLMNEFYYSRDNNKCENQNENNKIENLRKTIEQNEINLPTSQLTSLNNDQTSEKSLKHINDLVNNHDHHKEHQILKSNNDDDESYNISLELPSNVVVNGGQNENHKDKKSKDDHTNENNKHIKHSNNELVHFRSKKFNHYQHLTMQIINDEDNSSSVDDYSGNVMEHNNNKLHFCSNISDETMPQVKNISASDDEEDKS